MRFICLLSIKCVLHPFIGFHDLTSLSHFCLHSSTKLSHKEIHFPTGIMHHLRYDNVTFSQGSDFPSSTQHTHTCPTHRPHKCIHSITLISMHHTWHINSRTQSIHDFIQEHHKSYPTLSQGLDQTTQNYNHFYPISQHHNIIHSYTCTLETHKSFEQKGGLHIHVFI